MFLNSWFPNIVCLIAGCLISWGIDYQQGKTVVRATEIQTRRFETLMFAQRGKGLVDLVIGADGHIIDARQISGAAIVSTTAVGNTFT